MTALLLGRVCSLPIAAWLTVEQVEEVRHLVYVQRAKIGQKVPAKYKANQ